MLLHVSVKDNYEVVKSEVAICKNCNCECTLHLLREVRKVSYLIVLSSTEITYHLTCSGCKALYFIEKKLLSELGDAKLASLMERTNSREYPFTLRFLFLIWPLCLGGPLVSLIIAWQANDYRVYFGDSSRTYFKFMFFLTIIANLYWGYFFYRAIVSE